MSFLSYLGGSSIDTITKKIASYNQQGVKVSASHLPRTLKTKEAIVTEIATYTELINCLQANRLEADITIKLHQFGETVNHTLCEESVHTLVSVAHEHNVFVWLDAMMEDEVDFRLTLVRQLQAKFGNVGTAVQSYHRRSRDDVRLLINDGVKNIRLVKGIYAACQFPSWAEVGNSYRQILDDSIGKIPRLAIATHDPDIIAYARHLIAERQCKGQIEFQHMAGINDPQLLDLTKAGYTTRVYLPYGSFFKYFADDYKRLDWYRGFQRFLGRKIIS